MVSKTAWHCLLTLTRLYRLPTGAQVIWNTITDGPIRFNDEAQLKNNGLYVYEYYDDQIEVITGQVGMWVKNMAKNVSKGQSGTVPYSWV